MTADRRDTPMTTETTATPRQLRPYQIEAVQSVLDTWNVLADEGDPTRPVVVLPTGTGKSTVIATVAASVARTGARVVLLAHRRELLDQMAAAVAAVDPSAPRVGFVQGDRNEPDEQIVAASFQTLQTPARRAALGHRDVVLVDEVHHSAAETYAAVLSSLAADAGARFFAGFTATLSRSDGGLGELWDTVSYEKSLKWALDEGYLVAPTGLTVVVDGLDTTAIPKGADGDLQAKALGKAMIASADTTADAVVTHATGRRLLVFGATVEHCEVLAAALTARGLAAEVVVGSTDSDTRRDRFDRFTDGRLDALVTVQVLTEGTDLPACDGVVLARPTRSPVLYTQIVGRALRPLAGKSDALVLDIAGSTRDIALVTLSSLTPDAESRRVSPTGDDDPGQDEPAQPRRVMQREGAVDMVPVDLLGGTNVVWLATNDGHPFVECEGAVGFAFAHPDGAGYLAGVIEDSPGSISGWIGGDGVRGTLPQAREAVEATLSGAGYTLPEKSAPWRARPTPTDRQIAFADRLGVDGAACKTKARLHDDISRVLVSRRLDHYLK